MGLHEEVTQMEVNMMALIVAAFEASQNKQVDKLRQYVVALEELENEYIEITQKAFTNDSAMDRLLASLKQLDEELKNVPKAKTK